MRKTDQSKNNYFSILMANYNNAIYIETAINSVLSKTYVNWELIILDDCLLDNSIEIKGLLILNKYIVGIIQKLVYVMKDIIISGEIDLISF